MTSYRKPLPYRKPQTYRGDELEVAVVPPSYTPGIGLPWSVATSRHAAIRAPWVVTPGRHNAPALAWDGVVARFAVTAAPWSPSLALQTETRVPWAETSVRALTSYALPWSTPAPHDAVYSVPWGDLRANVATTYGAPWSVPSPLDVSWAMPWTPITARTSTVAALFRALAARGALIRVPWGPAGAYNRPYGNPWTADPDPPPGDDDPIIVPSLPVYFMIPTLTVVRLPERTPINAINCSISTDLSSWAWNFDMTIPPAELALVNPASTEDPSEVEITINGYVWTALVESFQSQRQFGSRNVRVSGRSRSAMLAEPFAPARTYTEAEDRDASQLADQELTGTGWTLVWDAVDWLVPGGTFSYADLRPIEAISRLAAAIGAAVQSDPEEKTLRVVPTYPVSPWAWDDATPYAIVPANVLLAGDGAWKGGANSNGIYVYSQNASFGALVKITGTGGEEQLPMVVDALIVDADSAQERGREELARSSRIKERKLTIPLFPSPAEFGLVPCGKLLEFTEDEETWRGQVVGVTITAQRNGRNASVRQVLSIERHYR